jgi:hypothetical protein
VVEDIVVGQRGVTLLPAVPRGDLPVEPGDVVDVVLGEEREEIVVVALDPDPDPTRVRLRVASGMPLGPGFEVWLSQTQSHVIVKPPASLGDQRVVSLARTARRGGT